MNIPWITLVLSIIVLAAAAFAIGRRYADDKGRVHPVVTWLTTYPLRWQRLVYAAGLFLVFYFIAEYVVDGKPTGEWWLAIGVIIGAFAQGMNAPDPSKSEVLTLAEKVVAMMEKTSTQMDAIIKRLEALERQVAPA